MRLDREADRWHSDGRRPASDGRLTSEEHLARGADFLRDGGPLEVLVSGGDAKLRESAEVIHQAQVSEGGVPGLQQEDG